MTVCQQFLRASQRFPEATMVHHQGQDYSYGWIASRSTRAAAQLQHRGLRAGDRVGVLLDNRVEYVIAYFAILLAGGIVVALNPNTTSGELEQTLVHAEPSFVISSNVSSEALAAVMPRLTLLIQSISLDNFSQLFEPTGDQTLPALDLEQIAQIIYTSGTTGRPKGVALSHGNLVANTSAIVQCLELTQSDSVFATLPFYYSYGNSLLLTHSVVGGRLVLASDFVFWNRAMQLMQDQKATGFPGVPSTFAMLLHRSQFSQMQFPDLRYITCAGGPLAPSLVDRLRHCHPNVQLYLMYGQTEATARLSVLPPEDLGRKVGSVGRAIPGVSLQVWNESQQPARPHEVGELYARGNSIMQGYWKDEVAARESITAFGLRTGDLASMDDEGYVYIVGRRSDMIKCGAFRVNPQEIEEVLLSLHGIEEAAVVGLFCLS